MAPTVLLPVADGCEDIEVVATLDTMRRCGLEVTVASVGNEMVTLSNGTKMGTDTLLSSVLGTDFDAIVVPGGLKGAEILRDTPELITKLKDHKAAGKLYAAICAAPALVFAPHGLFEGVTKAVCYPRPPLQEALGNILDRDARVVVDGNCITSRGPATSIEFGLAVAAHLVGPEKSHEVMKGMQVAVTKKKERTKEGVPTVLLPVAHGNEDTEVVGTVDAMRRCGLEVTIASVESSNHVTLSNGIILEADTFFNDVADDDFDAIVIPGGVQGSETLRDTQELITKLKEHKAAGKLYAAICAAPALVLATHGLLEGVTEAVCYPKPQFQEALGNILNKEARVVTNNKCITARGPGASIEFGLAIGAELVGPEKAREISEGMQVISASNAQKEPNSNDSSIDVDEKN